MTNRVRIALVAVALPAVAMAGLGVPAVPRANAEQGMAYLRTLGYQGVAFSDNNGDGLCQMNEVMLKDFKDGARDTVLWKELRKLYSGLAKYSVNGTLKYQTTMYVVVRSDKGVNAVEPKSGNLVFGTWFQDLSNPVELEGRFYAQAKGPNGKAWVDLSAGGKYKGEFYSSLDSIQSNGADAYYIATNSAGMKNGIELPSGKPVSKSWYNQVKDVAANKGDFYVLASTGSSPQWLDKKGRAVPTGNLSEVKGLYFADGMGALWGKNGAGEWGNVSLKGKTLGKGFQASPVGPLQLLANGPAFKSCSPQGCTYVDAKSGDDLLSKRFPDLGDRVWHFEGRDVLLAKDALGRWTYIYADGCEPLTGSWYTQVTTPTTANALFKFTGTKPSGQVLFTIVTPEGNKEEKTVGGGSN